MLERSLVMLVAAPFAFAASACHQSEPEVEASTEMIAELPDTGSAYGCDYQFAAEFSAAAVEELFADQLLQSAFFGDVIASETMPFMVAGTSATTVLEGMLNMLPRFEMVLRNPRAHIEGGMSPTILTDGQSERLASLTVELEVRALGGTTPEVQAWIARSMEVSIPVSLGIVDGAIAAAPDAGSVDDLAFKPVRGSDPLVNLFDTVAELGGGPAVSPDAQAATFRTLLYMAVQSGALSTEVDLPMGVLPFAMPSLALVVSASAPEGEALGDERLAIVASDTPTSCTGPFALSNAQSNAGFAAIVSPSSATHDLVRDLFAEVLSDDAPGQGGSLRSVIEDNIAGELVAAGFEVPAGTGFVPDPPEVTLEEDGFTVVVAEIPPVSQSRWVPFIDCDVTVTVSGEFSASFAFDYAEGYLTAEGAPSGALVLDDVEFDNCYGIDSVQEDIWKDTVVKGPAESLIDFVGFFGGDLPHEGVQDILDTANETALSTIADYLASPVMLIEEQLNQVPELLNQGEIEFLPINYGLGDEGLRMVGPVSSNLGQDAAQGPKWPPFEWFMRRPSLSLELREEVSQVADQSGSSPFNSVEMGPNGSLCTYTVEVSTFVNIIGEWEADPGDFEATFINAYVLVEGEGPSYDPASPWVLEVPFDEDGDNAYTVTLGGTWQYADGRHASVSETASIVLQGSEIKYSTGCMHLEYQWLGELRFPIDPVDPLRRMPVSHIERVSIRPLGDYRVPVEVATPLTIVDGRSGHWFFRGTLPRGATAELAGTTLPVDAVGPGLYAVTLPADFASGAQRSALMQAAPIEVAIVPPPTSRHAGPIQTYPVQFAENGRYAETVVMR